MKDWGVSDSLPARHQLWVMPQQSGIKHCPVLLKRFLSSVVHSNLIWFPYVLLPEFAIGSRWKKKTTYKHITLTGTIPGVTGDPIAGTLKGDRYYPVAFFLCSLRNLCQWVTSFQSKEWKVPCRTGELLPKPLHDCLAPELLTALPARLLAEQATEPDALAGRENDPSSHIWGLLQL